MNAGAGRTFEEVTMIGTERGSSLDVSLQYFPRPVTEKCFEKEDDPILALIISLS